MTDPTSTRGAVSVVWPGRAAAFLKAYVRSMRLYYAFVTGIAGWIGVAFARYLFPESASTPKAAVALAILFLSWGINQIVNDYLGLKEDRINAPRRPMVTGELNPAWALALSGLLMAAACAATWVMAPWALVPLALGVLLNVAYEYGKGVPFLGNVLFGVMLTTCTAYGYLATTPDMSVLFTPSRWSVLILVALMNGLMTYYTYFKDYGGDKAAGVVTAVVFQGVRVSRWVAILASPLPTLVFLALKAAGRIEAPLNNVFVFLGLVTLFLQLWTGYLYYRFPTGKKAYYSLVTNFRACTCGQVTLIALFNEELALYLYIAAYVFIGFLFDLYRDHQS
jgi:geranylgeranylglycerol-phosphate geranylgeranyltransferase